MSLAAPTPSKPFLAGLGRPIGYRLPNLLNMALSRSGSNPIGAISRQAPIDLKVISGGGGVGVRPLNGGSETHAEDASTAVAPSWIADALQQLREVADDADDMRYPLPTSLSLSNAEKFLRRLSWVVSAGPDVHSTPGGGVAIDFRNASMSAGVLFVFESDGQATWTLQVGEKRSRSRIFDGSDVLESGGSFALRSAGLCG